MKAAVLDEFGPSSVIAVREISKPSIGAGEVLVEVHAASVNPIDWKIGEGQMGDRYGSDFPMVLGFDASGVVVETGAGADAFDVGDEVFSRSDIGTGGCYAEFAALHVSTTVRKPTALSHIDAAAMPLAGLTALNGLRGVGELRAGQRVLINGATGGVGVFAVQIAKNMGAHVTGVCSTANLELARELGADELIDYTRDDPLAANTSYDVIYDTVGALGYGAARAALNCEGVYMTLVPVEGIDFFFPGQTERIPGGGYFLVWVPTAADLQILADWAGEGRLRPVIDSEWPLEKIHEAHQRSRTLRARGKIVIRVKDGGRNASGRRQP